jgi:hypothetical protein
VTAKPAGIECLTIAAARWVWYHCNDVGTLGRQCSRYLSQEDRIVASRGGELIGFVMLGNTGRRHESHELLFNLATFAQWLTSRKVMT